MPADPAPWHETLGHLSLLLFYPLAVLAARWLAQVRLQRLMNQRSPESGDSLLSELAAPEVEMTSPPLLVMRDASHALPDAVAAREAFVARALALFRRAVLIDVVAGVGYLVLLLVLSWTAPPADRVDLGLGLVLLGSVYPLLAALRFWLYRHQFRAVDAHFARRWRVWVLVRVPVLGLLRQLRWVVGPRWQAVSAAVWAALLFVLGLAWSTMEGSSAAWRVVSLLLSAAAVMHALVAWLMLQRMRREPGVQLLVLRVFGIDANSRFTFGRLNEFWRHFGPTHTVLDPSLWRERYPLVSLRTVVATLGVLVLGAFVLGFGEGLGLGAWAPWFTLAAMVLGVLGYAVVSYRLLRRQFVRNRAQLQQMLRQRSERPRHADLTFRDLEAMCHLDTWKLAVAEFARSADAVLMDLRGYCAARQGCEYEVDYLLDVVPMERVVFLIAEQGDPEPVRRLLHERWAQLRATSPNLRPTAVPVTLYLTRAHDEADVQGILDLLVHAASRPRGPPQASETRTGAWSLGRSLRRGALSMTQACTNGLSVGLTRMWSMRRPWFLRNARLR